MVEIYLEKFGIREKFANIVYPSECAIVARIATGFSPAWSFHAQGTARALLKAGFVPNPEGAGWAFGPIFGTEIASG